MVLGRDIKKAVKKKYVVPSKDRKNWTDFTQQIGDIMPKKADISQKNFEVNRVPKLDLHGFSLSESNKITEKFIIKSFYFITKSF